MTLLTYTLPEVGQADFSQDPRIVNALSAILTWAGGQITGANIKAEGLEGANCNKEIPKLTTGATYAEATHPAGAEFTPSATRPTVLSIVAKSKAALAASLAVKVNGVSAAGVESIAAASGTYNLAVTVEVPAGGTVKLEGTNTEGEIITRTLTK